MDKVALGKRIREARSKLNITQDILSEKANITVYYMGEIERGEKSPSLDVLIALAEALGVSCDYLLRDNISGGELYIDSDISQKLSKLSKKEKVVAEAILDVYINAPTNLKNFGEPK